MTLPRTEPSHRRPADSGGLSGPEGNERLTALTGVVLLLLFAAEGFTLLRLGRLLYWHYLLGFLLVGPVCLKIGSTVYRFTRYYTRHQPYVRKGPPYPLLRSIGPFTVLATITVIGTGVLLGIQHQPHVYGGFSLLFLHKLSFVGWAALMTVHVLAYLPRLPRLLAADAMPGRAARAVGGRGLRYGLVLLSLGAGAVLAAWGADLSSTWSR
ncbi:hypothetical protein KDL01_31515 [Actinospica durhamensis]|uniref:Uncharacterized protein n=1 Tax=Actinospica durhamensis TaxID=1508375 RepID=A0A941EVS4_9ACTN|nr:hypothetical protein [Actinospica durhamensis]MBR7837846.1 hypothetical protein [Actinospica durhamensis]